MGCIHVDYSVILSYVFGLLLIVVVVRLFYTPIRWAMTVLLNGLIGGGILWLVNLVGGSVGLFVAVNPVSALIAGFLGLPGVIVLLVINHLVS